ncbi:MAG: hypothetical protein MI748_09265 [Opitutales bacterium]|nr:hypothetical protein [Opitutales bacterium]
MLSTGAATYQSWGDSIAYQNYPRADRVTVTGIMKKASYVTLHVGKWYVGGKSQNATSCERGFDRGWTTDGAVDFWNIGRVYEDGETREIHDSEREYAIDVPGLP